MVVENHVAVPSGAPSSTMNVTPSEENRGSNTGASDPSSGGAESGACVQRPDQVQRFYAQLTLRYGET